jgi:branched-chain amino acid transport system substrate-binding protein
VGVCANGAKKEGDRAVKGNEKRGDRTVKSKHFLAFVLAILIVTALLAAGCGSPAQSTSTTSAVQSTSTTSAVETSSTTATTVTSTTGSTASVSTTVGPAAGEPIKVGVLCSLTGVAAAPGKEVVNALKLELKTINAAGGINGRPIEFVLADDASDTQKGVVAATKLIQDDKVTAILGPLATFVASPVRVLAEKSQIPIIQLTPASPADLVLKQKWAFNIDYSIVQQVTMAFQLVKESGLKKWVGFAENLPGMADAVKGQAAMATPSSGISFTYYPDTWDPGQLDVSGVVTKIAAAAKKEGADALYIGTDELVAAYIFRGLRDVGITAPIFTSATVGSDRLFVLGPKPVEGVTLLGEAMLDPSALPDSAATKQNATQFLAQYKAEYGAAPSIYASLGYDGLAVLADALKRGGTDPTKLRDAIESTKDLVALGGVYTFGPDIHGGAHGGLFEYTVKQGKFVYVKTMELQ